MADKRLRKRSARLSESDPMAAIEPPRKKPKKGSPPAVGKAKRVMKEVSPSPPAPSPALRRSSTRRAEKSIKGQKERKRLLVSLNIQDNDLQVSAQEGVKGEGGVTTVGGKGTRGKGRGRTSRQASQRRDQSVGSDGGSSNTSGSNGKALSFKNPKFTFSSIGTSKKRVWKNLKQMLVAERALGLGPNAPTYSSIDAPPSFKPPKKYSDLSGLIAKYTDPLTGLYYSTVEEFKLLRTLPQDVVQGYLVLRGKMTIS